MRQTGEDSHLIYKTGDPRAPNFLKDDTGEVILKMCRLCGRVGTELSDDCADIPRPDSPSYYCR